MAERRRETRPSYERILVRFGLLSNKTNLQLEEAYGLWQRVCADPLLDAKDKPAYMASVTAPYQHGAQILAAMSAQQLVELRQRVGCVRL